MLSGILCRAVTCVSTPSTDCADDHPLVLAHPQMCAGPSLASSGRRTCASRIQRTVRRTITSSGASTGAQEFRTLRCSHSTALAHSPDKNLHNCGDLWVRVLLLLLIALSENLKLPVTRSVAEAGPWDRLSDEFRRLPCRIVIVLYTALERFSDLFLFWFALHLLRALFQFYLLRLYLACEIR